MIFFQFSISTSIVWNAKYLKNGPWEFEADVCMIFLNETSFVGVVFILGFRGKKFENIFRIVFNLFHIFMVKIDGKHFGVSLHFNEDFE